HLLDVRRRDPRAARRERVGARPPLPPRLGRGRPGRSRHRDASHRTGHPVTVLLVLVGGAVGAPARYLIDLVVQRLHSPEFPWGTWAVNVLGSFVLGLITAAGSSWAVTLVGSGFCGAFTTFSTFGYETVRLAEEGESPAAVANVVLSLTVGLAAAALGWALGSTV